MYVETFHGGERGTVVMIPGGYHTGVCYSTTPDGRPGWAPLLADAGYTVHVTDLPWTGRSGCVPFDEITGRFVVDAYREFVSSLDGEVILFTHSLSGPYGFALAELLADRISDVVTLEPGPFGDIQEEAVPTSETADSVTITFKTLPFVLEKSKPLFPSRKMIDRFTCRGKDGHLFPDDPSSLASYEGSLQAVHPRLMYERFNIRGSQLRIGDYTALKSVRFLIITTPSDVAHVDEDPKIFRALADRGIRVTHWTDGEMGTESNSHMLLIEKNNDRILDAIVAWIRS